jgi:Reverse transcriptase (RNA-dependent DNA polymerase)
VIAPELRAAVTDWRPLSERLLYARFRHMHGFLSVLVCYAPTEEAEPEDKDRFYQEVDDLLSGISRRDLVVCLGDFNAVTGSARIPSDTVLGPHGSGTPNENSDRLVALCRRHSLRIGGSWFRRKDIHRFSWFSNDGHTKKEIDHVLVGTRWRSLVSCRAYRGLEFYSDHRPVVAVLRIHLKRYTSAHRSPRVRYDLAALRDPAVAAEYVSALQSEFSLDGPAGTEDCSVEPEWERFRSAIHAAAQLTIPEVRRARRGWISTATLLIVDRCREARLTGNMQQYRVLNHDRRRSLRHDRQEWANRMAVEGEDLLAGGRLHDAFRNFRRLKSNGPRVSSQVRASSGELITDVPRKLERWRQHFEELLNRPPPVPSVSIAEDAEAATPAQGVACGPPSLDEVSMAIRRLKTGKAAGVCGIVPELLKYGEPCASSALQSLCGHVWETGEIPADWRKGIILPLYKGKGDRTECKNYRGITLLSVPGKVFARVLLDRMRHTILANRRREQSGFTPGRSTTDRVLALNLLAQKRREFRQPLYAAYIDLKAAFDSIDRDVLYKLLKIIGIPEKLILLLRGLYSDTLSCVRCEGENSSWFAINSGVRQGCVLAPDMFDVGMDRVVGRAVARAMPGASIGDASFTDFDFADDVSLLAEIYDLLASTLTIFEEEAAQLGLQVNWLKTKVQSLSDFQQRPLDIEAEGGTVECVEAFCYLGVLTHESCSSAPEIQRRLGMAHGAFGTLKEGIWKSRIALYTKIRLFNAYVMPVLLYGSETWAFGKKEQLRLDAFGTKCLRLICGIKWSDFVTNAEVYERTGQAPVCDAIRRRRLGLLGHIARMPPSSDARQALVAQVPPSWRRPRGRPRTTWLRMVQDDLANLNLNLSGAIALAANRGAWRRLLVPHRATLPS